MDVQNLNIAVVGAGYAGAATARALINLGANVTVYEQASAVGEVGAGIGLRPSSLAQFRKLGILGDVEKVTSPSESFEILTATGTLIADEKWPETDEYSTTTRFVHRADFIDVLTGVLPHGVVKLGHRLETVVDNGTHANLTFTNGETVTADLVIGADGIRSRVRSALFSTAEPVFAGEHAYRVIVDNDKTHGIPLDSKLRMYLGHGTKVYVLPLQHRGQVSYDVTALNADPTPAPQMTRDDLLATLDGFDERLVAIARDLDWDQVNIRAVYDIDPIERWHSDAVVLVGDAAHAMCHHQGQGANSAILDSGALAYALAAAATVPAALAAYQAKRKPITDELQRLSRLGWSEDEVNTVFPGQKPGEIASTIEA